MFKLQKSVMLIFLFEIFIEIWTPIAPIFARVGYNCQQLKRLVILECILGVGPEGGDLES